MFFLCYPNAITVSLQYHLTQDHVWNYIFVSGITYPPNAQIPWKHHTNTTQKLNKYYTNTNKLHKYYANRQIPPKYTNITQIQDTFKRNTQIPPKDINSTEMPHKYQTITTHKYHMNTMTQIPPKIKKKYPQILNKCHLNTSKIDKIT